MDPEKRARRQSLRVIVSEIVMVVAVIMMVIILALIVSGYWLGSDFKVKRQGMLQISSIPTGASVEVDGDAPWFQRTNTSKILSSGEHAVALTKENYDSWSKTINITEGLLYKLNYPRLFLKERTKETVLDVASATFATVSPNRKLLLLVNNTTDWALVNLDNDNVKPTDFITTHLFSTDTALDDNGTAIAHDTTELFNGEILSANWDEANEHILMELSINQSHEWVLLNIKNPTRSINLTREFAQSFEKVTIFNHSASILLALSGGSLHKIDLDSMQISSILASNVDSYDIYDSDIVFSTNNQIGIIKNFNSEPEYVKATQVPAKVLFGKFYDNRYIFVIEENRIAIYKKDDEAAVFEATINFTPDDIKVGPGAEFLFMSKGNNFATLDMESMKLSEWSIDANHFGWLDGHMLFIVKDGILSVCDYDGLNYRTLTSNVSERFPVTITNDKWLYYFSDGHLVREWLIAK